MSLTKLNKAELIKEAKRLQQENEKLKSKATDFDKLNQKYEIIKAARKEDEQKVKDAENASIEFKNKEQELSNFYQRQVAIMKNDLDSQNETIISLFDMMDNTLNLMNNYYSKFKNVFISEKSEQKEE